MLVEGADHVVPGIEMLVEVEVEVPRIEMLVEVPGLEMLVELEVQVPGLEIVVVLDRQMLHRHLPDDLEEVDREHKVSPEEDLDVVKSLLDG